jgi:hypothetical protein
MNLYLREEYSVKNNGDEVSLYRLEEGTAENWILIMKVKKSGDKIVKHFNSKSEAKAAIDLIDFIYFNHFDEPPF